MQHLQSLIEDLRWLLVIGAVFVALAILTFIILTMTRATRWSVAVAWSHWRYRRRRYQRDGTPYPPTAPGICGQCGATDEIFYLPDGRRLCHGCYKKATSERQA